MKMKMEVRMKMNGSSLVIPPPLLRMDRTKQRHTQVLIIRWRFPRIRTPLVLILRASKEKTMHL
jgi:hypothetical protein